MFAQRARDNVARVAFCALVGGQDELVFDGHSCVVDHTGATDRPRRAVPRGAAGLRRRPRGRRGRPPARRLPPPAARRSPRRGDPAAAPRPSPRPAPSAPLGPHLAEPLAPEEAEVYCALVLGLSDYVHKNGFEHVVLGISGGIDSALVACLAVDALRPERVSAAVMPSRYSSAETQGDARALAEALGDRRRRAADRADRGRLRAGDARGRARRTRRRPRPRRTCRPASAATC